MNLLCLLWRGSLTGANGPNGLVSNDDLAPVTTNLVENSSELSLVDSLGLTTFALIKLLSDACHHIESILNSDLDLVSNDSVALSEDVSALGVTKNHPVNACILELFCTDFTSVCSILVLRYVLGADLNVASGQILFSCQEVKCSRCDDDLNLLGIKLDLLEHLLGEVNCELESSVLFPVSSN